MTHKVTKPIALDESFRTTEQNPQNIADVLANKLDAIKSAIENGGSDEMEAAFECHYNVTSATDIYNAMQEKKVPFFYQNGVVAQLWKVETNKYTFRTTSTRVVEEENILDIVDYIVNGSVWSTATKTISGGSSSQQVYLAKVESSVNFDTTGLSGMQSIISVNDVPADGVYQLSIFMCITPKTASATKSDLVFQFTGTSGTGMPNTTFHAVVDDSQTFAQQLSFSTTLNLKAGTNTLKMACGGLNTEYLVFVDNLTVAQLVNGVYHNGDDFDDVHTLTEAPNFNNDDGILVDGATGGPRFMLWRTLANKVLGFIKSLATTITAFRTGDVIPVDGPSGTAKMSKDDLLLEVEEFIKSGGNFAETPEVSSFLKIENVSELDTSSAVSGEYVDALGSVRPSPNTLYFADAVVVPSHTKFSILAKGYLTNIGMISKKINDTSFQVLVRSRSSRPEVYEWENNSDEDVMITISSLTMVEYEFLYKLEDIEDIDASMLEVSLTCFSSIGCLGDSYTAGQIYKSNSESLGTFGGKFSWPANLARETNIDVTNYGVGGATTHSAKTNANQLPKILQDSAKDLYLLTLGINDKIRPDAATYLGSPEDMDTEDYTQSADTYYGNYYYIIKAIQEHAPNALVVMITPSGMSPADVSGYYQASLTVAQTAGIPCLPSYNLKEYPVYENKIGGHPTIAGYSLMSRFYRKIIENYLNSNPRILNKMAWL